MNSGTCLISSIDIDYRLNCNKNEVVTIPNTNIKITCPGKNGIYTCNFIQSYTFYYYIISIVIVIIIILILFFIFKKK